MRRKENEVCTKNFSGEEVGEKLRHYVKLNVVSFHFVLSRALTLAHSILKIKLIYLSYLSVETLYDGTRQLYRIAQFGSSQKLIDCVRLASRLLNESGFQCAREIDKNREEVGSVKTKILEDPALTHATPVALSKFLHLSARAVEVNSMARLQNKRLADFVRTDLSKELEAPDNEIPSDCPEYRELSDEHSFRKELFYADLECKVPLTQDEQEEEEI